MLFTPRNRKRRATYAVEAAIVYPVAFFIILAIMIGACGISAYQQVAHCARETARFASLHGGQYATQNAAAITAGTLPSVDEAYLVNYAKANAPGLNTSHVQVAVSMMVITPGATAATTTETVDWDSTAANQNRSPYSSWTNNATTPATNVEASNVVIVTVNYTWSPGLFLASITLTSTAIMRMCR